MEEGEDMSLEELQNLDTEEITFDRGAYEVTDGTCTSCNGKLIKVVENRDVLDGAISFHIIKLRCEQCGKEYLDLNQAKTYDFLLTLERAIKSKKALEALSKKISE